MSFVIIIIVWCAMFYYAYVKFVRHSLKPKSSPNVVQSDRIRQNQHLRAIDLQQQQRDLLDQRQDRMQGF